MKRMFILIVALCVLTGCEKEGGIDSGKTYDPIPLTKAEEGMTVDINELGFGIFNRLHKEDKDCVLSPLSVSIALSMASEGAEGSTKEQMIDLLGFDGLSEEEIASYYRKMVSALTDADNGVKVSIANSAWTDKNISFKDGYEKALKDVYSARVSSLDFSDSKSVSVINEWCADNTEDKITDFVDDLSEEDMFLLLNALYFNGKWACKFYDPKQEKFTHADGTRTDEWMIKGDGDFRYTENQYFKSVEIPYRNTGYAMNLILPVSEDDPHIWNEFTAEVWNSMASDLKETEIELKFPRFMIEQKNELSDALVMLGMKDAFNPADAAFSKMSDNPLYISRIMQASYISVDEHGTEAAAVTGNHMCTSNVSPVPVFYADRPFVFMIRETSTGIILFLGYKS